ncbi:MAG: hypothetical protein H0W89_04570 [Candidatus Levybacteria bacterium]|nr:hypothetical protein [Candidatus Levybacteria bacterium]
MRRDAVVFVIAFIAGIFLDIFALRALGGTSIFLLLFVLLILLYQRKYEIYSYYFVMVASFIGASVFLVIFGYANIFTQAVISACMAVILFAGIKFTATIYDSKQESKVKNYAKR